MAKKEQKIRTVSYVHGKDGSLIRFDDLTHEQKVKAATELKIRYMKAMFPGVDFFVAGTRPEERNAV